MEYTNLISVVLIIVLLADRSIQDCRIVQTTKSQQNYWCNSIRDLESNGNAQLLDVNIYSGNTLPVVLNQTHKRTPNLLVVFADESAEGLSASTYKILKDLSSQVSKGQDLATIPKGIFENLPLQKLHLYDNGIQSITVGAFSNMQYLTELYITRNKLTSIETGIFNSLAIETLSLSNNKITSIKRNALFNMKNLKHLHLDGNSLSDFRADLFISYGAILETLWLQQNHLTAFDRNTVKSLTNLKVLNLGRNSISKIIIYSFENLLKLEELVLSQNYLTELDADIFSTDGMPSLTKLQINDNKLSFLTPKVLTRLNNLKYVRLGGNPWTCPCFNAILLWLADHNVQQFCDYDYYTGMRPVCVVPEIRPDTCDYTATGVQLIQRFAEINSAGYKECTA